MWCPNSLDPPIMARMYTSRMCQRGWFVVVAIVSVVIVGDRHRVTAQGAGFPAGLESYLTKYVKLAADQRAQLSAGTPVTKLLDSDPTKEVVVFGGVWIKAPIASYLAAVRDIEHFESGGGFRITKKISSPPKLEDFAKLTIP